MVRRAVEADVDSKGRRCPRRVICQTIEAFLFAHPSASAPLTEEGGIVTLFPPCNGLKAAKNAVFSVCDATESMIAEILRSVFEVQEVKKATSIPDSYPFSKLRCGCDFDLEAGQIAEFEG